MKAIGTISELKRFPVKSMLGEALDAVEVNTRGLAGDRVCALIDRETGKVVSAKLPHRWRKMLEFSARYSGPLGQAVEIVMPDGSHLDCASESTNAALSLELGRSVFVAFMRPDDIEIERANPDEVAESGVANEVEAATLPLGMAAPEGGFFDYAPIHFITTASLNRVATRSLTGAAEPARFRANIVIQTEDSPPFEENDWAGGIITAGRDLRLRVILPTPRCAVPTLPHGPLKADPRLTLEIGKLNQVAILDMGMLACLGAYAEVLAPGCIAVGDDVFWTAAA